MIGEDINLYTVSATQYHCIATKGSLSLSLSRSLEAINGLSQNSNLSLFVLVVLNTIYISYRKLSLVVRF